jgi:hypothetical protein
VLLPDPAVTCVHPGSLKSRGLPQVVNSSNTHDSTGSTVDTFLSQTDLNKRMEEFFPGLPTVKEEGNDNDSVSGQDGGDSAGAL